MKFSSLFLLAFLPVAIARDVAVRAVLTASSVSTTLLTEIDTKMTRVKGLVAPDLDDLWENSSDRRSLRGQGRDLQSAWCTNTCSGFPWGRCWTSLGFPKTTCGGWRELEVLSDEEVEQLDEDERHRHLTTSAQCTKAIARLNAKIQSNSNMSSAALATVTGNLNYTCYFSKAS